ncbi:MAG: serine hydrolase, partial [Bacteroidales bacterium]|nr:serine hydrolase [Bacteroidales bacterium]
IMAFLFMQSCHTDSGTFLSLEQSIDSIFAQGDLVGFSAGIIEGEEIVWTMTRGMADLKKSIPVDNNTLFVLGSLSKTVTGAALMTLYDKGLFSLDDDINLYLPFNVRNPNFPDIPITIRMLLTHTSSLFDNSKYISSLYACGDQTHISFEEYLTNCYTPDGSRYASTNFAEYKPGDGWEYCNSGYVFIAFLVERISNLSFPDYCLSSLFNPLEMNESGWLYNNLNLDNVAYNYISEEQAKKEKGHPSLDPETINGKNAVCHYAWPGYADGGLNTSPNQFANFMIMLMNGGLFKGKQILKPETVEQILTPQEVNGMISSPRYKRIDMGLTWWLRETESEYFFSHAGGGTGITTFAFFDPNKKYGAVFFITGDWHDKAYDRIILDLFRKHFQSIKHS